jgi:hypothetical protein
MVCLYSFTKYTCRTICEHMIFRHSVLLLSAPLRLPRLSTHLLLRGEGKAEAEVGADDAPRRTGTAISRATEVLVVAPTATTKDAGRP